MSMPTSNISPQRLLKPVSGKIQNDGAAFVPLSPHKGMHNAAIIYQAIKSMPDKSLVRGDFDKKSRPLIYFPERPPKKIGTLHPEAGIAKNPWNDPEGQPANNRKPNQQAVDRRNAAHDRAEMANFLKSIVEAAYVAAPPRSLLLQAATELRHKTVEITQEGREFSVGDLRKPLKVIARAYEIRNMKGISSPYRQRPSHDPELQARRLRQFTAIDQSATEKLCDAFWSAADERDGLSAVQEMQNYLKKFRIQREAENIGFPAYVRQHRIPRDVFRFAQCWIHLMQPDNSTIRQKLCTEAWSLEMDRICPLIVKEYKAIRKERRRGGSSEEWSGAEKSSTVFSRQASMPQLRPKSQPELVTDEKNDESKVSKSQKSDGSEPRIAFLSPKVEIKKVFSYSEIDLATLATVLPVDLLDPQSVKPDVSPGTEEQSWTANVSGNADHLSQEEQ